MKRILDFLRVAFAVAQKEVRHAVRSKLVVRSILLLQVLQAATLVGIDLNVRDIPTVIVDEDRTAESRELIQRLVATNTFAITFATSSKEQAREHIRAGRAKAAVVIPPDYGRTRAAGGDAHVSALVDGSDGTSSAQVVGALEGVVQRLNVEAETVLVDDDSVPSVTPHTVLLYNPTGRTTSFLLPGLLAILLGASYTLHPMRALASERAAGNLERLLMGPLSTSALIVGKLLPWWVIAFLNGVGYIAAMHWLFKVPVRGETSLVVLSVALYTLLLVSIGTYVGATSHDEHHGQQKIHIGTFPAMMLSGYFFPIASLPKPLQVVAYTLPQTHFIAIIRGTCLRGATLWDLLPNFLYFAILTPVVLAIAVRRFSENLMD